MLAVKNDMIHVMTQLFVQLLVLALVGLLAALKHVRFMPSELTEFELKRRADTGDDQAKSEIIFRRIRPQVDALRQVLMLLVTVLIVAILMWANNVLFAALFALAWLLVAEILASQSWFAMRAYRLGVRYQQHVVHWAERLGPFLRLLADSGAIATGDTAAFYSKQELLTQIDADHRVLDKDEKMLIRQALAYQDRTVKDIMTPRSVVVTVEADDTVGPVLLDKLHKSGHSRFPVVQGDLDHTHGILYLHSLVPLDPRIKKVSDIMSERVRYVHQDKTLDHILEAFLRTKCHLYMVVNEFEEVTGVVSIEDVLESLIGRKIVDEFDQYEDLRAVAKLVATERRKARKD